MRHRVSGVLPTALLLAAVTLAAFYLLSGRGLPAGPFVALVVAVGLFARFWLKRRRENPGPPKPPPVVGERWERVLRIGWWGNATQNKRIAWAVSAMLIWVAAIAFDGRPQGKDWLFIVLAPFAFAYFVQQIRLGLKEQRS